jgi:DNA-binding CsgD family transcriptional regulator
MADGQCLSSPADKIRGGEETGWCAVMQGVIDTNPLATFLLGDRGQVLAANRAAEALLAAQDGVVAVQGELALRNANDNRALQEMIERAQGTAVADDGPSAMRALRPSGKRPYSIAVSPFAAAPRKMRDAAHPVVCVMIGDPEANENVSERSLQALYGLSPAECRLAQRLAAGEDLKSAALALDIGYGTARQQLSAIFRKTETKRQGELVRLLCTLPPSLC